MDEIEGRAKLIAEAKTWCGTPYISNAMVKGRKGGTDCAMLLVGIYGGVGLIPKEFDPRPYPAQWHLFRNEEKYLNYILQFVKTVPNPPERIPLPGDLVMFRLSRVFAHGGIIVDWPYIIHARGGDAVRLEDISKCTVGKRALALAPQKFFSLWS